MGAKKKVDVPQPPPPVPQEKVVHNIYAFRTTDGLEYKLSEELIAKYSGKLKALADNAKDETIVLEEIDSKLFEVIVDFINLHKEKEPIKIAIPIKTNQNLKYIMEEGDAELVERVMDKGDQFVLKLFDLAQHMEMESLRRRLACGVALKLMKSTLE
jgi:hypothetical protein